MNPTSTDSVAGAAERRTGKPITLKSGETVFAEGVTTYIGEELAAVMFNYARQVIEANPDKVVENASSMLLLGYLIRVHEEGDIPPENPPV